MSDSYSRTEVDLKLENLEQRLDSKLDRLLSEIKMFQGNMEKKFELFEKDVMWLKWLTGGTFLLILGTVLRQALGLH